jgi:hypothetical protein
MHNSLRIFILTLLLFVSTILHAQPANGLLGHWMFNGNMADSSGNGNHGIYYLDTMTYAAGINGAPNTAGRFHNNGIRIPYKAGLHVYRFSVSAVVKFDPFDTAAYCSTQAILGKLSGSASGVAPTKNGGFVFDLTDFPSDSLCAVKDTTAMVLHGAAGANYPALAPFNVGALHSNIWYCLTLVYDSLQYKLYVDGVLANTVQAPSAIPMDSVPNNLTIGVLEGAQFPSPTAPGGYLKGVIDDLQFFNRDLSDAEVINLCNNATNVPAAKDNDIAFQLYPNPNMGKFTVQASVKSDKDVRLTVCNIVGQQVFEAKLAVSQNRVKQDITLNDNLPDGTYFLKLSAGETNKVERIILDRTH